MTSISAVSAVAATVAPQAAARVEELVSGEVSKPSAEPQVHTTPAAEIQQTIVNPAMESAFAAMSQYDNRGVTTDGTPRGVEVDRIQMIETGFEHMRAMIAAGSQTAQSGQSLDALV